MAKQVTQAHANKGSLAVRQDIDDSPLPSAEELEKYKAIDPNIVQFLMDMSKQEQSFRHEITAKHIEEVKKEGTRNYKLNMTGLICAFIITICALCLSALMISNGKLIEGSLFAGATIVYLIVKFIPTKLNNQKQKA